MPQPWFPPPPSYYGDSCDLYSIKGAPIHATCNVYIRLWVGQCLTNQLNRSRWPIFLFAEVHIHNTVGIFRTQLLSPPMIFVGGNEWVPHYKNILSPVYWMNQTAHIYVHSPNARTATTWVWLVSLSLVSIVVTRLFIPTFVYAMYLLIS